MMATAATSMSHKQQVVNRPLAIFQFLYFVFIDTISLNTERALGRLKLFLDSLVDLELKLLSLLVVRLLRELLRSI